MRFNASMNTYEPKRALGKRLQVGESSTCLSHYLISELESTFLARLRQGLGSFYLDKASTRDSFGRKPQYQLNRIKIWLKMFSLLHEDQNLWVEVAFLSFLRIHTPYEYEVRLAQYYNLAHY